MRIGQLVGFAEKRFSFDLVSRKKPAVEPVQTESVEPFESLILRRMPPEGENAEDMTVSPAPVDAHPDQPAMDAPATPAPAASQPLLLQTQMPAAAAPADVAAQAKLADVVEANIVSPDSVMAALTKVSTAPVDRTETMKAPEVVRPVTAPVTALPVTQVASAMPTAAPAQTETVKAPEVAAPMTPTPAAAPVAAAPMTEATTAMPAAVRVPAIEEAPRRATSRARTTFLGFDRSGARTEDVFSKETTVRANTNRSEFPFGWVVVIDGPGRGTSFAIQDGVSQIGRGDDQMVQLDFGDMGISRTNHAAIAFDDEAQEFFLGHGGKANIVRLNGRPVLSTEPLKHGDTIRIGETTLRFVAFCGEEFVWNKG